jgi:hypothetical protein
MNRPIRIGLIAEGEAELGASIPYIKPEDGGKNILENAIAQSMYLSDDNSNQRPLEIRWKLAFKIDLAIIKARCPLGYAAFAQDLIVAVNVVADAIILIMWNYAIARMKGASHDRAATPLAYSLSEGHRSIATSILYGNNAMLNFNLKGEL